MRLLLLPLEWTSKVRRLALGARRACEVHGEVLEAYTATGANGKHLNRARQTMEGAMVAQKCTPNFTVRPPAQQNILTGFIVAPNSAFKGRIYFAWEVRMS